MNLKEKILDGGDVVEFTAYTENYGVAEFVVCPKYVRGKLKTIWLYPRQQPNAKSFYRVDVDYEPLDWSISSWMHKGMDEPRIWLHFWCKEHKTPSFRFYVPRNAKRFSVEKLSNLSINFDL